MRSYTLHSYTGHNGCGTGSAPLMDRGEIDLVKRISLERIPSPSLQSAQRVQADQNPARYPLLDDD